jgi:CRP-like cAMP-binding protein
VRLRKDAKVEILRRIPLFSRCSKSELGQVAGIADELSFGVEETLIKEGDRGREFFVIVEGTAEVRRRGRIVRALVDGDFFGEIALVAEMPRTATVSTTSPTRALVIVDRDFKRLLRDSPSIQIKVIEQLAARLAPEVL